MAAAAAGMLVEVDVLEGLADLAREELHGAARRHGHRAPDVLAEDATRLLLRWYGDPAPLVDLRLSVAVSVVLPFDVSRPKALLGDADLRTIIRALRLALEIGGERSYSGLRLGMAGRQSALAVRLQETMADAVGLAPDDDGDLFVRVRPSRVPGSDRGDGGWDVLVRLTPRPLATRAWRVAHQRGGLNACIAAAMVRLSGASGGDVVVNLCSGSGTLAIECALGAPCRLVIGADLDVSALASARTNAAASAGPAPSWCLADTRALPLPSASVDVALADPPWGTLVGSHDANAALYPDLVDEAARVVRPEGRFVLVSHEVKLTDRVLSARQEQWRTVEVRRVFQKGHHPRIHVLVRR